MYIYIICTLYIDRILDLLVDTRRMSLRIELSVSNKYVINNILYLYKIYILIKISRKIGI